MCEPLYLHRGLHSPCVYTEGWKNQIPHTSPNYNSHCRAFNTLYLAQLHTQDKNLTETNSLTVEMTRLTDFLWETSLSQVNLSVNSGYFHCCRLKVPLVPTPWEKKEENVLGLIYVKWTDSRRAQHVFVCAAYWTVENRVNVLTEQKHRVRHFSVHLSLTEMHFSLTVKPDWHY